MTRASTEKRSGKKSEYWGERIAEQERSGLSVPRFCREHGLTEQSFYLWRKRLREQRPLRFALVEAGAGRHQPGSEVNLELLLANGERLRIAAGVDPLALRKVLQALRA
jgi:transposase-like protein